MKDRDAPYFFLRGSHQCHFAAKTLEDLWLAANMRSLSAPNSKAIVKIENSPTSAGQDLALEPLAESDNAQEMFGDHLGRYVVSCGRKRRGDARKQPIGPCKANDIVGDDGSFPLP